MSQTTKHVRGTTAELNAMTPAEGEFVYDTQRKEIRVGDGQTLGGFRLPNILTMLGLLGQYTGRTGGTDRVAATVTDLDDITTSGWYQADEPDHVPLASWNDRIFILHIEAEATSQAFQWAIHWTDDSPGGGMADGMAIRFKELSGNWGDWLIGNPFMMGLHPAQYAAQNIDIDDFPTTRERYGLGAYLISTGLSTLPTAATHLIFNIPSGDVNKQAQLAINPVDSTIWMRSYTGSWSTWTKLMQTPALDAVDSYLFATNGGSTVAPGATTAGSNLTPANGDATTSGSARTGTYRAMGAGTTLKASLWVKTAA